MDLKKPVLAVLALFAAGHEGVSREFRPPGHKHGQVGVASYYGWEHQGRLMADGKRFDALGVNAAHRSLPLGTRITVTNLGNHLVAGAVVQDRGPYVRGRMLDVSLGTARMLGMEHAGTARVRVAIVQDTLAAPRSPHAPHRDPTRGKYPPAR